jgi:hypothetical protein
VCTYGAGFGATFLGSMGLGADGALVFNETLPEGASCPSNGEDAAGSAAVSCGQACTGRTDFNACFCPCFKNAVTGAGVSWGTSMTCS